MSSFSLRSPQRLAWAAVLALLTSQASSAAEAPVPIASFFGNPSMTEAKMAPDGRHVAVRVNSAGGHDQLGVIDLADHSVKVAAGFLDADVGRFEWVNDNRLIYDMHDKETAPGKPQYAPGLFAVNADGSQPRQLAKNYQQFAPDATEVDNKLPWYTFLLDQAGAQDSEWVWVKSIEFGKKTINDVTLIKLNTLSGRTETARGPAHAQRWWLDAKGAPALVTAIEDNIETLYALDAKTGAWRKVVSTDVYLGSAEAIEPVGYAPDGTLYVIGGGKRDKNALYTYDLANAKLADKPLVDLEEFDFHGDIITGGGKLLGVRYVVDSEATAWFDAGMKSTQAAVDKLLPGRINKLDVGTRAATPYVLVDSWSDRQPSVYLIYNRDTGKMFKIGEARPAIAPARMAAQELVTFKARDGRTIPTWVTVPDAAKGRKAPMVVLVHGGPYVRGHELSWNADSQFLASRGYVVLEPEFRGSTGFGFSHFRAGWKQWGLGMQDDIADATRWAIGQGIADPKRICIAGASYGGYATLMGLVRDPDLYKCGVEWAGVTDIDLLYTGTWLSDNDVSDAEKRYGMPTLVGDRVKDAAQFAATSPLKQAARITQPLLLAYGGADRRVPLHQGEQFYDAVRRTNKDVEWVVYGDEGHGWSLLETRLDFWGRVEKFLGRQIGPGAK